MDNEWQFPATRKMWREILTTGRSGSQRSSNKGRINFVKPSNSAPNSSENILETVAFKDTLELTYFKLI